CGGEAGVLTFGEDVFIVGSDASLGCWAV
ncbi:hypothetical protein ETH_00041465, partial [Eimeria tenella]